MNFEQAMIYSKSILVMALLHIAVSHICKKIIFF